MDKKFPFIQNKSNEIMIFKVLIIGLGQIGCQYDDHLNENEYVLTHARAFNIHKKFELIGGIDSDIRKLNKFINKYKINGLDNINKIKNTFFDIVVISVPTVNHLDVFKEVCAKLSTKIIIFEKPVGLTKKERLKIEKIAKSKSLKIFVNYLRQCDPSLIDIKSKIDQNIIKTPFIGTLNYTGQFINNCSHFFVLFDFLLGKLNKIEKIPNCLSMNSEKSLRFFYKQGMIDFVNLNFLNFSVNEIKLFSKSGCLETKGEFGQIIWTKFVKSKVYRNFNVLDKNQVTYPQTGKKAMLYVANNLYNEILNQNSNLVSIQKSNSILNLVERKLDKINVKF